MAGHTVVAFLRDLRCHCLKIHRRIVKCQAFKQKHQKQAPGVWFLFISAQKTISTLTVCFDG